MRVAEGWMEVDADEGIVDVSFGTGTTRAIPSKER